MPTIPIRTTAKSVQDINLGRIQSAEVPGVGEQQTLRQFDAIVKSGAALADTLLSRQETRKKEADDLIINEAKLAFIAASREKRLEIEQTPPNQANGLLAKFKRDQTSIWDQVTADLTPDQIKTFEPIASRIAVEDNIQVARFEANAHNVRIDENYKASSLAAKTRAFDFLTDKKEFDRNIAESIQLNDALLERQGVDEIGRRNFAKNSLSKSVAEGIVLLSSISAPKAEAWFDQSLKDGELSTQDSIRIKNALDKRKSANEKKDRLVWAQNKGDELIAKYGEKRAAIFKDIEENTSGEDEVALKKEMNIRLSQIASQQAEDQRAFIRNGKAIVDQSTNAVEARRNITELMGSEKATIDTADKLDRYIKKVFEKKTARSETNPAALDEVYTRINKTLSGTASPTEIIDSASMIEVEYADKLSAADLKAATKYLRGNGFFGRTTYNDLLQSFSDMKEKPVSEIRMNKEDMKEFVAYLNYARPLLPPDKTPSLFTMQQISADFFIQNKSEGKTFRPGENFFETGFDEFSNETYQEAARRGEGLAWLPDLSGEKAKTASRLIAKENVLRKEQGKSLIIDNERNRSMIYKQRVMKLNSWEIGNAD